MAYTILNLKSDLSAILHGTSLSRVSGPLNLINRAARDVLLEIDFQETKRIAQITPQVFDDVYNYAAPSDLKGNKIIDIRPQINRTVADNVSATYSETFDLLKSEVNNLVQVEHDGGTKYLRIDIKQNLGLQLHSMDSITNNGTWAVGNDATNLTVDTLNYVQGSASLNFDLDGSTTDGYIENSTFAAVDLSEHEDVSSLFCWVYLPDSSAITSIDLRWGSTTSAYWNRTVTAPHFGSFVDGWNLCRFDWNGATETGSPSAAATDYARVTINYNGTADTDFLVDRIFSSVGRIYEIQYYSKFIFQDGTTNALIENADSDDDIVILDTDGINLLLYRTAYLAAQQIQSSDAGFDATFFKSEYETLKKMYRGLYKSEVEKPRQAYYNMRRPGAIRRKRLPS